MGFSLSWLAIKGQTPEAVRLQLNFTPTGEREEFPESPLTGAELAGGWYLLVANREEQVATDDAMRHLSSGGELVTCFVEEHVMVSAATGWKNGQLEWSITHDSNKNLRHLNVEGEPPKEFFAIRDRLFAKQNEGGCDYIFNVPVETAHSVTGYRHYQDIAEPPNKPFEVLSGNVPRRPTLLKRWFGSKKT